MSGPINPFGAAGVPNMGRPEACCGAFLRLSGDEARDLERRGTKLSRPMGDEGARREYRVLCDDLAHTRRLVENPPNPDEPQRISFVRHGLCARCSSLEQWLRRKRAETQKASER